MLVFRLKWGLFEKEDLVIHMHKNILGITLTILIAVVLTGCDVFAPEPTPTAVPTNTPLPTDTPVPTETPLPPTPTFTETLIPSPTSSPIPFTPPTPVPSATVDPKEAIRICPESPRFVSAPQMPAPATGLPRCPG